MQAKQIKSLEKLNKPIKLTRKIKLGCYKSYPLTGISSRDSGLASKEIRIGLEFKSGVLQNHTLGTNINVI